MNLVDEVIQEMLKVLNNSQLIKLRDARKKLQCIIKQLWGNLWTQ